MSTAASTHTQIPCINRKTPACHASEESKGLAIMRDKTSACWGHVRRICAYPKAADTKKGAMARVGRIAKADMLRVLVRMRVAVDDARRNADTSCMHECSDVV